jgi:hypothetical protein
VLAGLKDDKALKGYKVAHFAPFDPVGKRTGRSRAPTGPRSR